jgi:hypothetical protein
LPNWEIGANLLLRTTREKDRDVGRIDQTQPSRGP